MLRLLLLSLALAPAGAGASAGQEPPGGPLLTLESERITVHHAPGDSTRAARTLAFLEGQGPLPGLPPGLPRDIRVYLAPSEAAFDSLTGGAVPEWGAGVAVPGRRSMVIPAFAGERRGGWSQDRVLRHEWAHLGLHQRLPGLRIPRWFDEGYAEWASGGWDATEGWRLRVALATGASPAMDSLTLAWPRDRGQAELAYMLAGTAVEYLVRTSGERGLTLLLERWTESGSFETALRRVYGVTSSQFAEDWREYVKDRYGWLFVLSHSVVFWLFLTLVLLVMAWIRRRRNRAAMARLRATEPPERPAFWVEGGPGAGEPGAGPGGPTTWTDSSGAPP